MTERCVLRARGRAPRRDRRRPLPASPPLNAPCSLIYGPDQPGVLI